MNHVAAKALMLDDSTIFLFVEDPSVLLPAVDNAQPEEVNIMLTEYGFDLQIKSVVLPIEDRMIEHVAKSGVLVLMSASPEAFLMKPVYKLTVPQELIYEARGALNYSRKTR
jgi:hypothetical protein